MKLQCSCGAKYAFDATPEMLQHPVKFVCPACGLDSSAFINDLIRQEFGGELPPPAPPAPAVAPSRLKISHEAAPAAPAAPPASSKFCAKHRERATEKCAVCQKPICPKCLEMFGYFCSPLCKGKAEAQNLDVPVFAGRGDVAEAKFWRKTGLFTGLLVALVVLFLGAWIWYAWFGSVPHAVFSVRFADTNRGYSGSAQLVGPDQLVFLHGGTLARYDLKTKAPVWSQEVITQGAMDAAIALVNQAEDRANAESETGYHHRRGGEEIERSVKQELQSQLTLHVSGQSIWVLRDHTLTRYDWDSGQVAREITLPENGGELVENGGELQVIGAQTVTHVSLASGDSHTEQFGPAGAGPVAAAPMDTGGGLPGTGANSGQPLDPNKVEAQAQNLNLPGRLALPALLSNSRHEQQLETELNSDAQHPRANHSTPAAPPAEMSQLVPGPAGFALFSQRLLESRLVTHSAMKAPPKKSVLNGDLTASDTGAAANEIFNEMQRNAGNDMVTEDESRYQVTVHLPAADIADWTAEVTGPPQLFVLSTVNVVAAGKSLVVLDQDNKKLWDASLTYPVPPGGGGEFYGEGPCVEHGDTLYIFDQAVLTAFDLHTGNARWRLPSVGTVGLFFDDQGNVYVNTTTGSPDDIKYARQIDVSRRTEAVVFKLDPKTGKTLWSAKPGGYISYLSGPFIYVVDAYDPNPTDEDVVNDLTASLQKPAYLRLVRLRPADGRSLWEYYDRDGCPVNTHFDRNNITLVFKSEVEVLHYVAF